MLITLILFINVLLFMCLENLEKIIIVDKQTGFFIEIVPSYYIFSVFVGVLEILLSLKRFNSIAIASSI